MAERGYKLVGVVCGELRVQGGGSRLMAKRGLVGVVCGELRE